MIPLYNKGATIAETLASLLQQIDASFEIIVVDDGSSDGGDTVVRNIDDNRIRLLRQDNAGPGAARNRGIRAARGKWIAFLDADDLVAANHLAELEAIASAHPEAGLIGTAFEEVRSAEVDLSPRKPGCIRTIDFFAAVANGSNPLCSSSAAIRSDVPDTIGYFGSARLGEDREYWARVALSYPVAVSDRVTSYYRRDVEGVTNASRHRWRGKHFRTAGDIAPAAAVAEVALADETHADKSESLERFIDAYVGYCLHSAVVNGDVTTIRRLASLYRRGPPARDAIWFHASRFPRPLARIALVCFRLVRSALYRPSRFLLRR